MADQPEDKKQIPLFLRISLGAASSAISSFVLTWASLHGVDFKAMNVDSETIKSLITGTLTGIAVAPECIPLAIAGVIYGFRKGFRIVWQSFTSPLPPENKE